ncbi:MAG TPA: tryptophan--tRNA ligase, partial [Nanoarchaeota archaeon]|nr:tryptophan--tRNA ligase [Nanoarchaeota archaeon]
MQGNEKQMLLDPWGDVEIKNYKKLFSEFGLKQFPENWKKELNHYLFERGVVIAHRDFDKIMERIREKKEFIVITGIASSGKLHLGHKMIIDLVKHFKKFKAKIFFCIADIDAYTTREKIKTMEEAKKFALENIANVLALGLKKRD